jgi:PAS domain S-box-containing protein
LEVTGRRPKPSPVKALRTEAALKLERGNLTGILDSMADGVCITDRRHRVQYGNPALFNIFGPIDGRKCHEYFHQRPAPCPWCRIEEVFSGRTIRWEWYCPRNQRTYDLLDTPFHNPDGTVSKLEIFRDITERRQAELALRESEDKYRRLVEHSLIGVYVIQDGLFRFVNPRGAEILGYGVEEMVGRSPLEFMAPEDAPVLARNIQRRLAGDTALQNYRLRATRKDGRTVFLELLGALINYEGRPAVHGTAIDVTERVRAEEALEGERRRIFAVLDMLPAWVYLQAPDHTIRFANLTFRRLFGDPHGRRCHEVLHGRQSPCEVCPTLQVLASGKARAWEWTHAASGRTYMVHDNPFTDVDGSPLVLEVGVDISERRGAEEELARLGRLKDEFLSLASHELKTPITSIKIYAELAARRPELMQPRLLASLTRQADQLVTLVNDLLDVSRLELGRMPHEARPLDLAAFLRELCQRIAPVHETHQVVGRLPKGPLSVQGDPNRLEQVFQNLLSNAAKFSPEGSVIEVAARREGKWVRASVRDEGIGISAQDLPHIFERFYKPISQQAVYPGLGVGLYISQQIVESHAGRIWAESEPGRGSTFHVRLPKR